MFRQIDRRPETSPWVIAFSRFDINIQQISSNTMRVLDITRGFARNKASSSSHLR